MGRDGEAPAVNCVGSLDYGASSGRPNDKWFYCTHAPPPPYACADDPYWSILVDDSPHSCAYYAENDPGCETMLETGQTVNCPATCLPWP